MDIFAKSRELDEQLASIIRLLKSGEAAEDIHIEYKACALASQIMKDNLAKTVTAFLNSQDGGCFLIGIEEDAEKKPVLSGLEKTEIILDENKKPTGNKTFHNRDDYAQAISMYIAESVNDGSQRNDDCIRIKWANLTEPQVSICAVFIAPYFLKDNQIPAFAKIYESKRNRRENKPKHIFYQRQGNYTESLTNVRVAEITASRREGSLIDPVEVQVDTPSGKTSAISESYFLKSINENGVINGQPCLEINLERDGHQTTRRRLARFSKHQQIVDKARALIGHRVRTTTWGKNEEEAKRYEEKDYFVNLYPVFENKPF